MEGRLLARARARQEEIRDRNQALTRARRQEVRAAIPEIADIERALRGHMTELAGLALGRPGRDIQTLERENLALQARRGALLRSHGWDENYLAPVYDCPLCRDTGWTEQGMCSCLKTLYKQEQTRELAPLLGKGGENFDAFRLDYYSASPPAPGEKSPRDKMRRVLNICQTYAADFGEDSPNLFFSGAPGLGKTFLSAAIAQVVAERGFSVAYDTVSGLLSAYEREKFSRDEGEQADAASRTRQLLSCDLLIVDDLGTEMSTAFTQNALYTLLDGRLRGEKKTIVSSNLDAQGVAARYGAALASRLAGEYEWLEFTGRDIRAQRKEGR